MGWFDEQIKQRIENDDALFTEGFSAIGNAVIGKKYSTTDSARQEAQAIRAILKYYGARPQEVEAKSFEDRLELMMRPTGIMRHSVKLTPGWYKDAVGPMIARLKNGVPVAVLPTGPSGYSYYDPAAGGRVKLNAKTAENFAEEAICFYRPFPLREMTMKDLLRYIFRCFSLYDYVGIVLAMLAATLVGLIPPALNNLLFGDVLADGNLHVLVPLALTFLGVSVSALLFTLLQNMLIGKLKTKARIQVQAATMMRLLSVPADFFRKYTAGDLAARAGYVSTMSDAIIDAVFTSGLASLFSLLYLAQIVNYAPALAVPSVIILLVTAALTILATLAKMRYNRRLMTLGAEHKGLEYALIAGVQKIKLSGSEKRVFAKWANSYAEYMELNCSNGLPWLVNRADIVALAVTLIGTVVMYFLAVRSGVSVAEYTAFNTAYGEVSVAFTALAGVVGSVASIKPTLELARPILAARPETDERKRVLTRLTGAIELNNVSFRYTDNMPLVLDNLSLKIRAGQYVAVVGRTGCGKSTLMRLLLGFERPQKGAIYYDGQDLTKLDLKSLRRNLIGVVTQDGKLFQGDIFSNIVISAPHLTLDDAWRAAEIAGIADDIRKMPMGMNTLVSEGGGAISGGQRQRLMIARAVATGPKILMLDEATSALDNITQKKVSDALASLKCTRFVIAHRLSTIKECDRILVLDGGKIVEDGKYDDLLAKGGLFAELVERQRIDR